MRAPITHRGPMGTPLVGGEGPFDNNTMTSTFMATHWKSKYKNLAILLLFFFCFPYFLVMRNFQNNFIFEFYFFEFLFLAKFRQ
jgi:hypothetical protein